MLVPQRETVQLQQALRTPWHVEPDPLAALKTQRIRARKKKKEKKRPNKHKES